MARWRQGLESYFQIRQRGSTVGREVVGGLTTFMAMSYILFVQPVFLRKAGMDTGGVFMATCLASALACFAMGWWANYPIALAPGMGENTFFVFTLCGVGAAAGVFKLTWQEALALTCIAGVIFLLLSTVGLRSMLLNAIPDALKSGMAAGIGLFIALIGFEMGNLVKAHPATLLTLADLKGNYAAGLTLLGLVVMLVLLAFHIRGAILIGILATTVAAWAVGRIGGFETIQPVELDKLLKLPGGLENTAGKFLDGFGTLGQKLFSKHAPEVIGFGFIVLFMDMFDTVGTLVGVASRADLMREGRLPKAELALGADAAGTVFGATLGTSTVTSYIESIAGVAAGARTGLAAFIAGICLLGSLFLQPLVEVVAAGMRVGGTAEEPIRSYPMIAPAMILVGAMMMRAMREVEWEDVTEAVPAFLATVSIPFTYSIATGIAVGFITYALGKLLTGRARQCPAIVYVFAALFVVQYAVGVIVGAIR